MKVDEGGVVVDMSSKREMGSYFVNLLQKGR